MTYLTTDQYLNFGLDPATPEFWVAAASSLIDAHCCRPSLGVFTYTERMRLTPGRHTLRLTHLPLVISASSGNASPATTPFTSVRARYADPRRGDEAMLDPLALDIVRAFGLPGTWTSLDPSQLDYDPRTGEVTLAANVLGIAYNEIEITYSAGFTTIPDAVMHACAQIVRNAQATPALNVKSGRLDQVRLDYFADSLLDDSVRTLLAPFVSTRM
jgi:hypothetical protein